MGTSPRSLTALLALLVAVAAFVGPAKAKTATAAGLLATQLSEPSRSEEDRLRDAGRNPAGVLTFLGVAPGMTVLDVIAASGYYTEVLSVAVGADGKVYAQNNEFVLKFREGANDKAITARLADNRLPNVERVDAEMDALPIPDGSVDVAITALNFHDIYNGRGGEEGALAFLAAVHAKLKPGGAFGIVDHDGDPEHDNAKLHRIEKQKVLDVVAKSAFTLEGESKLLANSGDDHSQGVFAPGLRGNTDRFVLLLRKAP